jgi:hypothetical protein
VDSRLQTNPERAKMTERRATFLATARRLCSRIRIMDEVSGDFAAERTFIEILVQGLVGGAGYVLGGAAGAVAAGMAQPAVSAALDRVQVFRARRMGVVLQVGASAARTSSDELVTSLVHDAKRLEILGQVVEAAARTTLEGKILGLARVLANTSLATDDATVDSEAFILRALADIEAPELHVLRHMADVGSTSADALRGALQTHDAIIGTALGTLGRHGAAVSIEMDWEAERLRLERQSNMLGGAYTGGARRHAPTWKITDFGYVLLRRFDELPKPSSI